MEQQSASTSAPQPFTPVLDYATPAAADPLTISRPPFEIATGALMYLVAAPVAALVTGGMLGGLLYGLLTSISVNHDTASSLVFPVFLLCAAAAVIFCVRDYLRRAHYRLRIFPDRIEGGGPLTRWSHSFAEIETVTLARRSGRIACIIVMHSGRHRRLPPDIADFRAVETTLNAWLIPSLAAKVWQRLIAGEVLQMKGRRWLGTWRAGGFGIALHGLIPRGKRASIAWDDITAVDRKEGGVSIVSTRGKLFASFDSRHFWPASFLIESRVQELRRIGQPSGR